MVTHGLVGHDETAGDGDVVPAPGQEIEDLTFPGGELGERVRPAAVGGGGEEPDDAVRYLRAEDGLAAGYRPHCPGDVIGA
jgi:hypothetical protein